MTKLTPYDWQLRDLAKLRAHNYTGLIAIEAGGGKSLTATLAIADAKPRVTLIIAPKSTHNTAWIPTVRDNAGITPRIIGNDNKATKAALMDFIFSYPGVYLASPQYVTRTDVSDWRGDMLIVDEIHMAGAITPKAKLQRKLSGYHYADGQPLSERFPMRMGLSATPMRSSFSNLWGVTRFLYPERDGSGDIAYRNFILWQDQRQEYTEIYTARRDRDGNPVKVKQYMAEKVPGLLISQMNCVVMHKRRETCCDAHIGGLLTVEKPQIVHRTVELTPRQKKSVREMNEHMITYIGANPLTAEISLTQKQRVRQLTMAECEVELYERDGVQKDRIVFPKDAKSPVIDEIVHILSNLPEGEPVVVYSESRRFAEIITHQLTEAGFPAEEYSGVTKADLTRFGKDYQVLVGTVAAIGTGTAGLNHVSATEIFADQPISLTMLTQTSARLERLDNTRRLQRFVILDDLDVQSGRMEDLWTQQLLVNRTMQIVGTGAPAL